MWHGGIRNLGVFSCTGWGTDEDGGAGENSSRPKLVVALLALGTEGDRPSGARILISVPEEPFQAFLIWYILCRVFSCTLVTRNKYINCKVDGELGLHESSCSLMCCVGDPPRILSSLWNCAHIFFQSVWFLSCVLYWSALPPQFSGPIKDAKELYVIPLTFSGVLFTLPVWGFIPVWMKMLFWSR